MRGADAARGAPLNSDGAPGWSVSRPARLVAENDLKEAAQLARTMVLDWGMSERLGNLALGNRREHVFLGDEIASRREYSEATARAVDKEVKQILDAAYQRARRILEGHRDGLDRLAEALLEHEELVGDEAVDLIGAVDA